MKKSNKWRINLYYIILGGFSILFLITFSICWIKRGNQQLAIPILMLKILGFATCFFLIMGEFRHPLFDAYCPKGEKLNCHAVLESPAATLFGFIHMADLGAVYYAGGIILVSFSVFNPHFFHQIYLLAILNLLTLPYTIFSVVYQAFVVKKWCFLCLIVQLIFWLEFSHFYQFIFAGVPRFTFKDFFPIIWSFGLPLFTWLFFRPIVKKAIEPDKQYRAPNDRD